MKRLTERCEKVGGYRPKYDNGVYVQYINKLGQLEDIEEELGIDLIILFKALREKGIWIKNSANTIFHLEPRYLKVEIDCDKPLIGSIVLKELYFEDLDGIMDTTGEERFMDDYGKTWAITKEELENEYKKVICENGYNESK